MINLQEHISLKPLNTFGIDVAARYYAAFSNISQLEEALSLNIAGKPDPLILGGGSNILFTKNVDALVLKNEIKGIEVLGEDEDHVYVKAGAGEGWHQFVLYCLAHNFAGVENLSLIPGNVGASPMQNIGAYGVEIKDVFYELEAFHIKDKVLKTFSIEECAFGYRESVFKRKYKGQFVITSVTYKLFKKPLFNTSYGAINEELAAMGVKDLTINLVSQAVINIRSSKLPDWKVVGNAGSFFKNPQLDNAQFKQLKEAYPNVPSYYVDAAHMKVPAGWLIEQCGWKGYRKGDAGCYPKQALVLVNYGEAKGSDIFNLSEEIIQSVQAKFGVTLEREVNIF